MAQKSYCGDNNNKARQIPNIGYCGDEHNKARKLLKGYCGDSNNKARQFWGSGDTSQKVLKPAFNWVPGGTHALDTCPPIMGVMGALNLARKILKPYLIINNALQYYGAFKAAVINKFLSVQGNANVVYVNIYGTATELYMSIYYGHVDNLQRTITSVSTSEQFGSTNASISESVRTTATFSARLNISTGAITIQENPSYVNSYSWIGVEVDRSTSTTLLIRLTNLGMTMYSVDMIYDWYWNFASDNPLVDEVDGFTGNEYGTVQLSDGIQIENNGSRIMLPAFIWGTGRTIEISIGAFDRQGTQYSDYTYYSTGDFISLYTTNASQYSTHLNAGIRFDGWQTNDPDKPYPTSQGIKLSGRAGAVHEQYLGVNGLLNKKFQIKLPESGGWTAGSFQFIYADSGDESLWQKPTNSYFRIGNSGAPSAQTLYKYTVKSVAVY